MHILKEIRVHTDRTGTDISLRRTEEACREDNRTKSQQEMEPRGVQDAL